MNINYDENSSSDSEEALHQLELLQEELDQEYVCNHTVINAISNTFVNIDRSYNRNYSTLPTTVIAIFFSFIPIRKANHLKLISKNWNQASKQSHSIAPIW